ncbi:MAG: oligosaccharide flippase family protein, partial [Gammaproteobacteria bacterium]|nr:oligosaccharide flippase family protein [Gammaproteobacteria bacterium]
MDTASRNSFYLSSASALIIKLVAVSTVYLLSVTIARRLGAEESGYVFYGMTLVVLISAIARFGLDNTLVRFVAAEKSSGNFAAVKYIHKLAIKWASRLSFGIFALLALLVLAVDHFNYVSVLDSDFSVYLIFLVAIPFFSILNLDAQSIKGMGRISLSVS